MAEGEQRRLPVETVGYILLSGGNAIVDIRPLVSEEIAEAHAGIMSFYEVHPTFDPPLSENDFRELKNLLGRFSQAWHGTASPALITACEGAAMEISPRRL